MSYGADRIHAMTAPRTREPAKTGGRPPDSGAGSFIRKPSGRGSLVERVRTTILAHRYLFLFFFVFVMYNINFRTINSADTLGASLLPFVILDSHVPWVNAESTLIRPENIVSFMAKGDVLYPAYPIVTPVLVTPLYILPYIAMNLFHIPLDMTDAACFLIVYAMEKLAASIVTAAAVVVFYAGMRRVVRSDVALATALILAFGTGMWSINSQALWQHGTIAFLFAILFFFIVRNEENGDWRNFVALGICSSLLVFARPADLFLALPAFVYAAQNGRKYLGWYLGSAIPVALPFVAYNLMAAGTIFGGYGGLLTEFSFTVQAVSVHMAGVLVSPSRGLLVFTPLVLLAVPGVLMVRSRIASPVLQRTFWCFFIALLLEIFVYSSFNCWWGGTTYGPRFFAGSLPLIFVLSGIALDGIAESRERKGSARPRADAVLLLLIFLVAWSVFVQIVGAFYYPNGNWNDSPPTFTAGTPFAQADTARLWDVRDNQIARTFLAGPIVVNPVMLLSNLGRSGDIVDPATDFAIRLGIAFGDGWSEPGYSNGTPFRLIGDHATLSVQYLRYSIGENACTLTLVASAVDTPKTLDVAVNGEPAGTVRLPAESTEVTIPIRLNPSLRLGNNVIQFHVQDCPQSDSGISTARGCIAVRNLRITRNA